jgi:secreted PhoX family phosphatase
MGLATSALLLGSTVATVGCEGEQGPQGPAGQQGPTGPAGAPGRDGTDGQDGSNGQNGQDGQDGQDGEDGQPGSQGPQGPAGPGSYGQPGPGAVTRPAGVEPSAPLSSVIAITFRGDLGTGATNVADYVKARVDQVVAGNLPTPIVFPLPSAATDTVRTVPGLFSTTVIKWMDPIGFARTSPRFGTNADYIAFFGDGWSANGNAPQFRGNDSAGWMWVNHEYLSGNKPNTGTAPLGSHLDFAKFLRNTGVLSNNVTDGTTWQADQLITYNREWKKQVGGTWMRLVQDPATGEWAVDRAAANMRYDATSSTLAKVVGVTLSGTDRNDSGALLPEGIVAGTHSNCSGGQTPWGTIITAEENVQFAYGDPESALWTSRNNWNANAAGFAPGAPITPNYAPPTTGDYVSSDVNSSHIKDGYGYLTEIDPGQPADLWYERDETKPGVGHRKLGAMGRARWENAAFVVGADWKLLPNQPIVVYAGDDRRGGRIFKFVTSGNYTEGMTKKQIRDLLNDGKLYAAHFAGLDNSTGDTLVGGAIPTEQAPGQGRWVELSLDSTDLAPNGEAYGQPTLTVGAALRDANYNAIGGFTSNDDVRKLLWTVANKVGVMELNRPEDLEWNPRDPSGAPLLYVAFTEHGDPTALDQQGRVATAERNNEGMWVAKARAATDNRSGDRVGSIFGIREADTAAPGSSRTFTYFRVWKGETASLSQAPEYSAAKPDNLAIDREGGVWFGTDGNYGVNRATDSVYYLNQNPAHRGNTYFRRAFRVVSMPSDAEATGPAFSPDMKTLFISVQHPGEDLFSVWP